MNDQALRGTAASGFRRVPGPRPWLVGLLLLSALLLLLDVPVARAQMWGRRHPPHMMGYDLNTVVQVRGTVAAVESGSSPGQPVWVRLQPAEPSEGSPFLLWLGPQWFVRDLGATLAPGDRLVVKGSKLVERDGRVVIIVQTLEDERSGHTLRLRGATGHPLWRESAPTRRRWPFWWERHP